MSSGYAGDQAKLAAHRVSELNDSIKELNQNMELNNLLLMLENGLVSKEEVQLSETYLKAKTSMETKKLIKR